LQVSSVHVYMTYPFVLSWSCLEAMSAGCLMVASDTPPVRDVIEHGKQGLLFDFMHPEELARTVQQALDGGQKFQPMRDSARQTVVHRYDFEQVSLPGYLALLD
jgi:glycosyltransferase involved in cell wall biosynthesis